MTNGGRARILLLVGCGELGSRHLQAIASLPQVGRIDVVDPRPEALALGRERLSAVAQRASDLEVRWLSALGEAQPNGALCLVATCAQGRGALIREIAHVLSYHTFLVEKLVAPSVVELEALRDEAREAGWRIWVNCKTRAYPFHQRVKQHLHSEEPILFSAVGGNHGLATNGVHLADLFAFYDGAEHLELVSAQIDPVLHPAKRGRHLYDLSGTLQAATAKGSRFLLSYASEAGACPDVITVTTRRYRYILDQAQRWAVESDVDSGWVWRPVPVDREILVSQMTMTFVAEILATGRCQLPTLEESLVAHRFILNALQPHFSQLLERELEECPVT